MSTADGRIEESALALIPNPKAGDGSADGRIDNEDELTNGFARSSAPPSGAHHKDEIVSPIHSNLHQRFCLYWL